MKIIFRLALFFSFIIILGSCKPNRLKVDVSDIQTNVRFVHFGDKLFELPLKDTLQELKNLRQQHPDFFDLFTYRIIRIGGMEDDNFASLMTTFITDTMITSAKQMVEKEFEDFEGIEKEIETAFKHFKYYFPEKEVPAIYTYVSGFNQSVVTSMDFIGISLDKYLGRDCNYYKLLSTAPDYKVKNMHRKKIPADVMYSWGMTEFNNSSETTTLLDNMIREGKLMYFTEAMLPETPDSLIIGYTQPQLEWAENNEAEMWMYLVEHKMLYSNKRMDIIRYTNDGPYTSGFPLESPGRTGVWIGWQIVRKYMDKNPEVSLKELMENTNYQEILNASGYFPE